VLFRSRVDAADCVTASATAVVDGSPAGSLTIDGLAACPAACPTAGTVAMTAGERAVAWSYDGSDTVTVTGSGGQAFALPLLCGR